MLNRKIIQVLLSSNFKVLVVTFDILIKAVIIKSIDFYWTREKEIQLYFFFLHNSSADIF